MGGLLYAVAARLGWAQLLQRTFAVDVLKCPTCHGRLRFIGAVNDAEEARIVLHRLGLCAQAPAAARARDPTDDDGAQAGGVD